MMEVLVHGRFPRGVTQSLVERTVQRTFARAKKSPVGELSVSFVTQTRIAQLNKQWRNKNRPTDVLSFSPATGLFQSKEEKMWGDIFIASAYARREAERRGIPLPEEIFRLVAHGVLHLMGYDHATEAEETRMFTIQERAVGDVAENV